MEIKAVGDKCDDGDDAVPSRETVISVPGSVRPLKRAGLVDHQEARDGVGDQIEVHH